MDEYERWYREHELHDADIQRLLSIIDAERADKQRLLDYMQKQYPWTLSNDMAWVDEAICGYDQAVLAERARAADEYALRTTMLDKATVRRVELELLARDLAEHMRQTYAMLAMHHLDMTATDALLARAAAILEAPRE